MEKALQDFMRTGGNDIKGVYYLEGATMDGDLEFDQETKILQGSATVDGTRVSFQLGVDGMGGECEPQECISFTNSPDNMPISIKFCMDFFILIKIIHCYIFF